MRLALLGDTMLGRGVAARLEQGVAPESLVDESIAAISRAADLTVANLECCVSRRGERWPDPDKPFFFRAPPEAVGTLVHLGVDAVTLANNHALDYGPDALRDTLGHLADAGIAPVGAGIDVAAARRPIVLETASGERLGVAATTDHPRDYAAGPSTPGVAFADVRSGPAPPWLTDTVRWLRDEVGAVLVSPHWGPNMVAEPVRHVRRTARALVDAGASLVAGHSAHVFHGIVERVLFDLGDFLDDYATHPELRNDLGLLWSVDLAPSGPTRVEAVPLHLDYARTEPATGADLDWIRRRLERACATLGTEVREHDGRFALRATRAVTP